MSCNSDLEFIRAWCFKHIKSIQQLCNPFGVNCYFLHRGERTKYSPFEDGSVFVSCVETDYDYLL